MKKLRKFERIARWWNRGGGNLIGFDDNNERMYSLSNGELLLLIVRVALGAIGITALSAVVWMLYK